MSELVLFKNKKVRRIWHNERWYFSIVDVCEILTDSPEPRKYWSVLKNRLKKENSELTTICSQLKMQAADGKFYNTDCADAEGLLRIIQSIPSPKALEAVKQIEYSAEALLKNISYDKTVFENMSLEEFEKIYREKVKKAPQNEKINVFQSDMKRDLERYKDSIISAKGELKQLL